MIRKVFVAPEESVAIEHGEDVREDLPEASGWFAGRTWTMGRTKRALLIVFGVAVLVRLAVFLSVVGDTRVFMQPDSEIYLTMSENLLQQGQLYPDSRGVASYLVRTPGYPLLMAFVLRISGGSMYALE